MGNREVRRLRKQHLRFVELSCDEYHGHSRECLSGPKDSLIIIKLADELLSLRVKLKELARVENKG